MVKAKARPGVGEKLGGASSNNKSWDNNSNRNKNINRIKNKRRNSNDNT
jgi:hypothetical protein